MERITTMSSFTLAFTDKETMDAAIALAESDDWRAGHGEPACSIEDDGFSAVEFWWDNMSPDQVQQFISEANARCLKC